MLRTVLCAVLIGGPVMAADPLPLPIGGAYTLTDQHGRTRTEADPDGYAQLVFFGYVNCQEICSAALPLMAEVADALAQTGHNVTPVMITVDPVADTPQTMRAPLADLHPQFVGLTGDAPALDAAYDAFKVEINSLFTAPDGQTVYAHGSMIHLMDSDGRLLTLLPPILDADRIADIARGYLSPSG